jgi:hypothetical protein
VTEDTIEALALVVVEPGVDGVGVAGPKESAAGDGVGGTSVGDLEEGGAAFADVRLGVMVAVEQEFLTLGVGQGQGTSVRHRESSQGSQDASQ